MGLKGHVTGAQVEVKLSVATRAPQAPPAPHPLVAPQPRDRLARLVVNGLAGRQSTGPQRILLLQGPVGPFFKQLHWALASEGHSVRRICFNAGDILFSRRADRHIFIGGPEAWQAWLKAQIDRYDLIILFGAERPAHRIARDLAQRAGKRVISLEEGYVRPGFITLEEGGNNAASPLAGALPPRGFDAARRDDGLALGRTILRQGTFAAAYYIARGLCAVGPQRRLFHRRAPLLRETWLWTRNITRRLRHAGRNFATVEHLLEHCDGRYYLVPLQVGQDANLAHHAMGWGSDRLIRAAIASFARAAPANTRLVFKIHPMERGHNNLTPLIRRLAAAHGIAARIDVIEIGSLGLLARHAAGMITINSTSGLSAIHHGVPLLVLGRALYAHPALATCAFGYPDFDRFWRGGFVADATLRARYLAWIGEEALAPGDFYATAGIGPACDAICARVRAGAEATETAEPRRAAS